MENLLLILVIISVVLSFHEELGLLFQKWSLPTKDNKTQTTNEFAKAVKNLELMDEMKYNCVIQHNGEWVYGWMENKGISIAEGMNNKAYGENAHISGIN